MEVIRGPPKGGRLENYNYNFLGVKGVKGVNGVKDDTLFANR